jgi:hypothetical protein
MSSYVYPLQTTYVTLTEMRHSLTNWRPFGYDLARMISLRQRLVADPPELLGGEPTQYTSLPPQLRQNAAMRETLTNR